MSTSKQIGISLVAGIAAGLFFGEIAGVLSVVATAYIRLLQMTVLPYITVSLISGLGALGYEQAKALFFRVGGVLLAIWALTLGLVFAIPLAFPSWESASFFSTTLIERPEEIDFLSLFIPSNPFFSLANNIVPAVVLFSVVLGVALIGVEQKDGLLEMLRVVGRGLMRATRLVMRLTPVGLFAIAASVAGTMSPEELGRLQVFFVSYVAVALLVTFWVLPALVSTLTPIPYRDVIGRTRDALLTAFVTGELFVVLPMLAEKSQELLQHVEGRTAKDKSLASVIVPASFNFPHAGKVLSLSFILFAGWFADVPVSPDQYPTLAVTGLVSFFGSVNVAVPFLLDLFRIPADMFELFVASSVVNQRFGALIAAMHTLTIALLGTCALSGALRVRGRRLLRYAVITVALTAVTIGGIRILFATTVENEYERDKVVAGMQLLRETVPAVVHRAPPAESLPVPDVGMSQLDLIRERGYLRVGYWQNSLPYAYFNAAGDLVGLDVEMAHHLADELGVGLEFVPIDPVEPDTLLRQLDGTYCDLVMSGIVVTTERARDMLFSESYLEETVAFIVKDHRRTEFASFEAVARLDGLRLGVVALPFVQALARSRLPRAELIPMTTPYLLFEPEGDELDGAVMTAERGSAWTLLYPQYSVVVPESDRVTVPLAYPIAGQDLRLASFVNTWLSLKRGDGTLGSLFEYWVLGQNAEPDEPRWSLIRDVLHWVD